MDEARLFPRACVASPHHLASAAGLAVLASGGNALDAAIATNLTLGVVTPYLCGYGGDLFAIVVRDGDVYAYNGSGRAPAAATVHAVREAAGSDRMPESGALTVTVPGAVEGWFALLDRFGSRSFGSLAEAALSYARAGFAISSLAAGSLQRARDRFSWSKGWQQVYGGVRAGDVLRQPGLAGTIEALSRHGPDAYYRGPIGEAIAGHLRSLGALMGTDDLPSHRGEWIEAMWGRYRGVEVLELPPNTQGVTVLEALQIVQSLGPPPPPGPDREHLLIEATKLALADRDAYVSDPVAMTVSPEVLASEAFAGDRARLIDRRTALSPATARAARGGTAYVCAADADGMLVSLIQSNYMGFGSGITVPEWGINLQNRGAFFSLDPGHVNAIAPGKRTLHTLIPAMAFRHGKPWLVFGSMGGDGQAQIHLQLLARIVDDEEDLLRAISAPRWVVSPEDWSVRAESRMPAGWLEDLRARGHRIAALGPLEPLMGHAHAIMVTPAGYAGASDPRAEGAVLGL